MPIKTVNKKLLLLITLLTISIGTVAFSQSKRPMTFEDIVGLNRASDAQISPDGRRVAFVVTAWDRENDRFNSDLWLAYDTREPALRLTANPKRDDHPRWSPDLRRLAFLSERGTAAGDASSSQSTPSQSTGAQIYLLNIQGGEPIQLTSHKTPVQSFEWSPDGRFIAFIAEEPRDKPKNKPPVVPPIIIDEDYRYARLWICEVATKQVKQFVKGSRHIMAFNWSLDGSQIVFTSRATPRLLDSLTTEVFTIPFDSKNDSSEKADARQLSNGNGAESEPRFSPDGRWVSYLAHADGDPNVGPLRIHIVPVSGGEPRTLGKSFDGYITSYRWLFDSQRFIFLSGHGVNARIYTMSLLDQTSPSPQGPQAPQAMTRDEGVTTSFSATVDGTNIAFTRENPRLSSEVALLSARIMVPVYLTHLNQQIEQFALGQVDAIKWKSNDGTEIEGLLVYPIGYQTGRRYPLLTYIHGGPESAYTKGFNASWSSFPQVYAANGYAVFMPNFRGSSNYGAKFAQANAKLAGKLDFEDVISGVDELIKTGIADENKLAIAGWSYGGYLSAWIIGHTNRFKCAAYGAGLSNAVSYWGTADIVAQRERLHGGPPWEARKMFDEQSPLSYLTNVKTPVLIFHGEKDERVPLGQSFETYRTLKRLGVTTQMVIYPEQGHGLNVPSYQLDKMRREFAWIEKYVR